MAAKWVTLDHSNNAVKKAGKLLRDEHMAPGTHTADEIAAAREILSNYRSAHSYSLNAAQNGLRSRIRTVGIDGALVTQRLKEAPSIVAKLVRGHPRTQLSTLQDVAGARAVVPTTGDVDRLLRQIRSTAGERIVKVDDYVREPQPSGYRGVHVVIDYAHRASGRSYAVELQLRSEVQHEWAAGVEAIAKVTGHALKQSEGPPDVLNYLAVVSRILALSETGQSIPAELINELRRLRDQPEVAAVREVRRML